MDLRRLLATSRYSFPAASIRLHPIRSLVHDGTEFFMLFIIQSWYLLGYLISAPFISLVDKSAPRWGLLEPVRCTGNVTCVIARDAFICSSSGEGIKLGANRSTLRSGVLLAASGHATSPWFVSALKPGIYRPFFAGVTQSVPDRVYQPIPRSLPDESSLHLEEWNKETPSYGSVGVWAAGWACWPSYRSTSQRGLS